MIKKIAIVVYSFECGGVQTVSEALCSELSSNFELHLIAITQSDFEVCDLKNTYVTQCNVQKGKLSKVIVRSAFQLASYVKKHAIDLLLLQTPYVGIIAPLLKILVTRKIKIVYCDHGSFNRSKSQVSLKDRIIYYICSHFSDKTVVLNDRIAQVAIQEYYASQDRVISIPNWYDALVVPHTTVSTRLLSVGRLSAEKGIDRLIEAFALVHEVHPEWILDIVGDGPKRAELQHQVEMKNLNSSIKFWGIREDVAEFYRKSSIYILPSYREGMPMVLLEAKSHSLPIVAFDIMTGPREMVQDGVDGFLVEDGNVEEMAQRIIQLIEDPKLREEFSKNSTKILELYAKDRILKQWYKLFQTL